MKKNLLLIAALMLSVSSLLRAQTTQMNTYCNPLNIDYTYAIYDAARNISYRSGADPAVVRFRGEYYMFVTRSMGYWHSTDLSNWTFIKPEKWYFQGSNAPAAQNFKDSVLYVTGDPSGAMSVLYTDNPKKGDWKPLPYILSDIQDPDLFIDDDGQAYMFWGSSNTFPLRGMKLDRHRDFRPSGEVVPLFNLKGEKHGWERFGENHSDTVLKGYMEGAWLTKYKDTYYMQYAAPGTEFNVYGDGVYTSKSPLGPYIYAPNNPVFYKPGGFANGAGHGSTVLGPDNRYWHFASMSVSVNVNWERRLCMFPVYFDKDGLMYSNTSFGDYPHYSPSTPVKAGAFTGWMLLSYKKPVKASTTLQGFDARSVTDESIRTFWVAASNDSRQWIEIDLQKPATVYAIQLNYHDYKSDIYGRAEGLNHRYTIQGSKDGKTWITLADRSESFKDVPNDYVELSVPQFVRYIRYNNIHVPTRNLAISGLRVFGKGGGKAPKEANSFTVKRKADRRDALISWKSRPGVQGYNVLWGIAPDKLYNSWMVYDTNTLELKSLDKDMKYFFSIEAFNENGVSERTRPVEVP